ncbi:MAG: thiamine pyrophosphate-dependent dehydrogenase E1 component subunit alpha, partial [Candidatus Kapaibacteriota bacterium]
DGGSQTGEFHEAMNFASVQKLPLILIIENNQYAYSSPNSIEFACEQLSDRAKGYGCHGITIDGTDIELVYETTLEAVKRARNGDGPTIIETITMRMRGHAEHDDFSYVPKEMLAHWQNMDPVDRYIEHCIKHKALKKAEIDAMRQHIIQDMRDAIDAVIDLPFPPPEEAFRNVFID